MSAQNSPFTCSPTVSTPLLRAEGVSEQIGDIVITCTGGTTSQYSFGQPLPTMQVSVTLGTTVTSRLLNTAVFPNVSEALLLIDEPGGISQTAQTLCSSPLTGAGTGGCPQYPFPSGNSAVMSSSPNSLTAPANVYQGLWNAGAPGQITFPAIPVLTPVFSGASRIYRITNIRANIASSVTQGLIGLQQFSATISMNGGIAVSLFSPVQTVGYIETSLATATHNISNTGSLSPPVYAPCGGTNPIVPVGTLQFSENYGTAFKTRVAQTGASNGGQQPSLTQNVPGANYNSESGFTVQTANGIAGLTDYGTRLKATFHGIPAGVRLFVSVNNVANSSAAAPAGSAQAAMVTGETTADSSVIVTGGFPAYPAVFATTVVGGIPAAEIVADSTGTATAVWESITNTPSAIDSYSFEVYALVTATATANGSATVNLSYAPTPPPNSSATLINFWGQASGSLTLPRFLDNSTASPLFSTAATGACFVPQLSVTKTHAGNFNLGSTGSTYTIVVGNTGGAPTSGTITVVDTMPAGLTAMAVSGNGWTCTLQPLICTTTNSLAAGSSFPPILITVTVALNAVSPVTNQVSVTGGNSASAATSDVTVLGAGPPAVTSFSPSNGSSGIPTSTTLSWGGSTGANYYQVYLGTTSPPPLYITTSGSNLTVTLNQATVYYWSVTAVNASGSTNSAIVSFATVGATITSGNLFVPVTPCRVLDTRTAIGTFGGPSMTGGSVRTVAIPAGGCNIPSYATAYALNVTVAPHGALQYLTIWPASQGQPFVSTLNSYNGAVVANAAIVPAGSAATGGAVSIYASDATDVILDINGYFAPATTSGALSFYPLTPCRVVDTRASNSAFGPYLTGGTTRTFVIPSGTCSVPGTAAAFALNITVVPHGPLQYLTVWPEGVAQPVVSTLNSYSGAVVANAAIVPGGGPFAGPGGVNVYATNDTDLIIDINGYFGAPGSSGALAFYPVSPCRAADTRSAGAIPGGGLEQFSIVQSSCGVPGTAQAFSLNVTAVPNGALNYLTVWPAGHSQPVVSTLNSPTGTVVANAAIVQSGSGSILIFASNPTNVVVDINGYFGQ